MKSVDSVAVLVMIKTGSRNEQKGQEGISHVLEHMLFKGTKKYPTPLELASVVDRMGGEFNAFTGKEYTGYYIKSARNHLDTSLGVLSQMLLQPLIEAEALEREKGVVVEEINMYEDLPMEKAGEEFENLIFAGSDLGREVIGSVGSVRGLDQDDVRSYINQWYKGANVLIVVAGKVDGELKGQLEKYFGGFIDAELAQFKSQAGTGDVKLNVVNRKTEQAHFVMGLPAVNMADERRYPLAVLRVVLGGNMSSRLFTEIREKRGLAYYVRASMDTYFDHGYMAVSAGVKLDSLREAVEVVREQILEIGDNIRPGEVEHAKEFLKGKLVLNLEEPMGVARFYADKALVLDQVVSPEEVIKRIEDVSLERVKQAAEEFFREEFLRTVVVGPYDTDLKLVKKTS